MLDLPYDPLLALADRLDPAPDPAVKDPVNWIHDHGAFLWSTQRRIIESVRDNRYTAVPSCFDTGKSFLASAAVVWWLKTHPVGEAFVVTTAPTDDQVKAILWREIDRRVEQWELGKDGHRVTQDARYKIGNRLVAYGRKPSDYTPAAFQGIHDRYVLVVLDEAAGIPDGLYDAADGLVSNEHCRVLAIGNPDDPNSHFATICKPGSGWNTIPISAFDTPNFTGEDVPGYLKDLLVSQLWVEERRKRWGEQSPMYISKVLGQFPQVSKDMLIEPGWVLKAQHRRLDPDYQDATFGCDIARFGNDRTMFYLRQGWHIRLAHEAHKQPTDTTAGHLKVLMNEHPYRPVANIDDDGIGGAVTDLMVAEDYDIVPLHNGAQPYAPHRFGNARSEWYWNLRDLLSGPSGTGGDGLLDIDIFDDELAAQLLNIKYKLDGKGRIWVETKDEMRKRGVPSPDKADAVCYACVQVASLQFDWDHHKRGNNLTGDIMKKSW